MMSCRTKGYNQFQQGMMEALDIIDRTTKEKIKELNKLLLEHKDHCRKNNWKVDNDFIRYVKIKNELRVLNQQVRNYKQILDNIEPIDIYLESEKAYMKYSNSGVYNNVKSTKKIKDKGVEELLMLMNEEDD